MSLGAIDFGLIVDGAVIIVENAVRRLAEARAERRRDLTPDERSDVVREATRGGARAPACSASAIIAIVYLPILSLRGIEGKLFRPMARTVLFALLGAFVALADGRPGARRAIFLRPAGGEHETWLDARQARRGYLPLLRVAHAAALRHARAIGLVAAGAGRRVCSPGSAPSSSRSSTRATCSSKRGACPASP